jgi:hypothetical protein
MITRCVRRSDTQQRVPDPATWEEWPARKGRYPIGNVRCVTLITLMSTIRHSAGAGAGRPGQLISHHAINATRRITRLKNASLKLARIQGSVLLHSAMSA